MPQTPIAAQIHQPLDVGGDLTPEIAFHNVITINDFANLQHFLVGELRYSPLLGNADFLHDFIGLLGANAMDILQGNDHALVGRYIDTGDARQGSNSCYRSWKSPALG